MCPSGCCALNGAVMTSDTARARLVATRYVRDTRPRIHVRVAPIAHPPEAVVSLFLPGAAWRPIWYRLEAGQFAPGQPVGYIPHVPVCNGSLFRYFNGLVSPNRKFSTAWVAKDGTSEQYTELINKPWAQATGNPYYHAFEVEGYPNEPYTAAQINTLAVWHNFLGTDDALANSPGQRGIGVHYMGGTAWGGHTCPDPQAGAGPRSRQRQAIINRAIVLRGAPLPVPVPKPTPAPIGGLIVRTIDLRNASTAHPVTGLGIKPLQRLLGIPADGYAGQHTRWALGAQQAVHHLAVDYIFGPASASAFLAGN